MDGNGQCLGTVPGDIALTNPGDAMTQAFTFRPADGFEPGTRYWIVVCGTSGDLVVSGAIGPAAQAFGPGRTELYNTGAAFGDKTALGGTLGLFVPGTGHHLALELILAPPLKMDFEVSGRAVDESLAPEALVGDNAEPIPTGVPPLGRKVGTIKALPPNLTVVYRPWLDTRVQPYVGLGAMYLYTYDSEVNNDVLTQLNEPTLYTSKPVACLAQLGVDVRVWENVFISVDAKYADCAEIEAKLNNIKINSPTLSPTLGPVDVAQVSTTVEFEALMYQFSVGMRF